MFANQSFTSADLLIGMAIGFIVLMAIIFIGRYIFAHRGKGLTEKYKGKSREWSLRARNKYPDVDVLSMRSLFLRFGLITTLAVTVLAFNWTLYEKQVLIPEDALALDEEIEIEVPRSAEPPPPPPPPPPPVIEEVPNELVLETDEDFEFVDQSVDMETAVEAPKFVENTEKDAPPPPPPPPPPPEPKVKEIFKIVEEMPRFPGCEEMQASIKEKQACSNQKLLEYIYSKIRYPQIARENGIEGTVVIRFVVNKDGSVTDIELMRDIGAKCGDEAVRIVEGMNEMAQAWIPGKQRGKPVNVMFTLPIKFKLEYQ